jgi:BirA family transcriptional regulator, biotin operon repressor / biotin---[acetyl-CoA-carboxylase] ligase
MNRIGEILAFLRESHEYVSGDYIAGQMKISRTAIWKYIKQLEGLGYKIDKVKGKGYCLKVIPDRLFPWEVESHLRTSFVGRNIVYRDSLESTNSLAFSLALKDAVEGTVVVAESQRAGKGRLQRRWFSPYAKNLYLSIVLRPQLHPSRIYPLTFMSSLAVFDTLVTLGIQPQLKWPNDVLVNGKKICGTLTELSTEADAVRFVVIGIGFNVNMKRIELIEEISSTATSLLMETKKTFERARVCGMLLTNMEKYYGVVSDEGTEQICRIWENRAAIKGKALQVVQMDRIYRGISDGIDQDGGLLLNVDGKVTKIIAGDVSV